MNPQESNVLSRLETNERLATKLLSPECGRALQNAVRDPYHGARVPTLSAVACRRGVTVAKPIIQRQGVSLTAVADTPAGTDRVGSHPAAVPPEEPAMLKNLIVLTTGLAILALTATAVAHRLIEHLLSG